jgi:hypothetical protein
MLESLAILTVEPSDEGYRAARAREDARLRLQLDRLARGTPQPMPDVLTGDTPEREAQDHAIVEAWTRAEYARCGLDYDREMARHTSNRAEEGAAELRAMLDAMMRRTREDTDETREMDHAP